MYGIIRPKEIYSSKVIKENTGNPSSRWVNLEIMLDCLNKHKMLMNKKDNVYVIPSDLLNSYFNLKIIDEQYEEMAKYIFEQEKDNLLSEEKISRIFRDRIVSKRKFECEFCNCFINVSDQLVASHINAKSNIRNDKTLSDEEKFELMTDEANGFLLCRVHDSLFDKKHITLTDNGQLIIAPDFINLTKEYNIKGYVGKKIININKNNIKYLEVHRKDFCRINKIDDLNELIKLQITDKHNL